MIFGALKDFKIGENRVICTPTGVASIVAAGHTVLVRRIKHDQKSGAV